MSDEGRYKVVSRLAAGGMAEVYRGESAGIEGFRKKVAIKRVLPKLSQNQEFIDMFLDEARLGAYLSHSKCVQVFDIGQAAGAHFIVMEFVDGADLKAVLEYLEAHGLVMPVEVACLVAMQICEGLGYAHQASDHDGKPLHIVHRDISPHNVLMTRHGEVKLVDFGLAKASSHLSQEDEDIVKGKFGYLAPEVTLGKGSDHRVDVFAAGILLWEMLAGRRLFHGANDVETFKLVQAANIPDLRRDRSDVSAQLMGVINKALARDAADRYQDADDFAEELSRVLVALGKSVTYRELSAFVDATARERDEKKRDEPSAEAAGDLIGDLIIDALHDFSSLLDDKEPSAGSQQGLLGKKGVDAKGGDFIDPTAWDLDDGDDDAAIGLGADGSSPPDRAATPAPPSPRESAPPSRAPSKLVALNREDLKREAAAGPAITAPTLNASTPAANTTLPWILFGIATLAAIAGWLT